MDIVFFVFFVLFFVFVFVLRKDLRPFFMRRFKTIIKESNIDRLLVLLEIIFRHFVKGTQVILSLVIYVKNLKLNQSK